MSANGKRTPGYPGILAIGSYSPLTGKKIPNIINYCMLFLKPGWTDAFLLPLSMSENIQLVCCRWRKTQGKLKLKHAMCVPHSARCPVEVGLPTSRLLGWRSTNWAIDPLASVSANLLSNALTYFFHGRAATNPFLHVLARVLFSPCCLCFGFAACRADSGGFWRHRFHIVNPLRTNLLRTWGYPRS